MEAKAVSREIMKGFLKHLKKSFLVAMGSHRKASSYVVIKLGILFYSF